jgi:myo-inositol-1(or 4)-monophosphatase
LPVSDLALLVEAAREAGKIALRYWKNSPETWDKDDGAGPVTEADLAVNRHLEQVLREARPSYGWLSEESEDDPARLDAQHAFIVDPIDGTRAFIAGESGFAHALAVVEAGRVLAGVVYLPAQDQLYAATFDGPALLNGAPIRATPQPARQPPEILANAATLDPTLWPGGLPEMRRAFRPSLANRLCLVAAGRYDAMITLRDAWEWDIAAGVLIAERAGARATDGQGAPLLFNRVDPRSRGAIVAHPVLHANLVARRLG